MTTRTEKCGMTVAEIARQVGGRVIGNCDVPITSVSNFAEAAEGQISFVEDPRLFSRLQNCHASCLLVSEEVSENVPESVKLAPCVIKVRDPKLAIAIVAELLHPRKNSPPSIHSTAVIAADVTIGERVFIGAFVYVGEGAKIGDDCQIMAGCVVGESVTVGRNAMLYPNVVLYEKASIGERVILHAGVCIGSDGFGYVRGDSGYRKFPQIGTVVIEDDVEIGAYTCIDRGSLGKTRIGRGTKIDNLVQIAHNVDIGERVVIAAQTGISGSTVIEDDAVIGGQVGMGDHARVQKGAIIGSKAGILPGKIVRSGVWWGIPVQPLDAYKRLNAHVKRLPQMQAEIKRLREQLEELSKKIDPKN